MTEFVDDATRHLLAWLGNVLGMPVQLNANAEFQGVALTLARIDPAARLRHAGESLILSLQYRVTVQVSDPFAAQRALGELAFAALMHPDYDFRSDETATIPALLVSTSLSRTRQPLRAPAVRRPLRVVAELSAPPVPK